MKEVKFRFYVQIIYHILYISRIKEILRGVQKRGPKGGTKDSFGGVQMRGSMFYRHPPALEVCHTIQGYTPVFIRIVFISIITSSPDERKS